MGEASTPYINAINWEEAKQFTDGIAIPPQPQLLWDIKHAYPELDDIAALIARDPSVSAAVLKTVNAPCFGVPKKIISVQQAVMLLGLDSVMNIINGVLLQNSFSRRLNPKLLGNFWQSANDSAVACSALAQRLNLCRSDEGFILGLFHNCAMPLIRQKYTDYFDTIETAYATPNSHITELENRRYEANHATIGSFIARAWHLPLPIVEAIEYHHDHSILSMQHAVEHPHVTHLCLLLKMAEHITREYHVIGRQPVDHEWLRYQDNILEYLGLDEHSFIDLSEDIIDIVHAADQY